MTFYQGLLSPQVKRSAIISNKHGIYELPNDLRLKLVPSRPPKVNTVDTSKNLLKNINQNFSVFRYFTWKLKFVSYILWMIVDQLKNKHMKTAVNLTIQFFERRYQKKYLVKDWSFLAHQPQNNGPVNFCEIERKASFNGWDFQTS